MEKLYRELITCIVIENRGGDDLKLKLKSIPSKPLKCTFPSSFEKGKFRSTFYFTLKLSPPLFSIRLVLLFHLINTRQIAHRFLSSISLHSGAVFKYKKF